MKNTIDTDIEMILRRYGRCSMILLRKKSLERILRDHRKDKTERIGLNEVWSVFGVKLGVLWF